MKPTHYRCQVLKTLDSVETVGCGDHPGGVDQGTSTQQHPVQLQSNLTRVQHTLENRIIILRVPFLGDSPFPCILGDGLHL